MDVYSWVIWNVVTVLAIIVVVLGLVAKIFGTKR
jgi:hypothetical protein